MIVRGVNLIGMRMMNQHRMVIGTVTPQAEMILLDRSIGKGEGSSPSSQAKKKARPWWERPSRAERKENRQRMAEESLDAALTYGSWAWLLLNPNKWSLLSKIVLTLTPTVGGGVVDRKDYTDYDPQGA